MVIPLSGGSGGAGGNPEAQFPNLIVTSGEGGGGGGSINLFGRSIESIDITADGDDGRNGGRSSEGGPGSGGTAMIMSKIDITNFSLSAEGGSRDGRNGGAGRVRYDGMKSFDDPNVTPNDASKYRGVSTDTSNYIKPRHTIFGTKDPDKSLELYIKPKNGDWALDRTINPQSNNWLANANFPINHDDEYYLVVVQKETKSVSDFTYVPDYILSQAATNILLFDDPEIYCPIDTSFDVINCANTVYEDSIQIQSIGGDYLSIIVEDKWIFGNRGFEILNLGNYDIIPQSPDSLFYIKFRYTKIAGQTGTITDTLLLYNNTNGDDTCRIAVNINLNDPEVVFLDENSTQEIDTLYLGEICVGDLATGSFNIRNDSEFDLTNLRLEIKSNGSIEANDFTTSPLNIASILKTDLAKIDINFNDLDNNVFIDGVNVTLLVYSEQCVDPIDSLVISVKVFTSELALSVANNTLDFANVQVGGTKDLTVSLTNVGDKPARILTPPAVNAPFSFVSSSVALPYTLNPLKNDASAKIDFTYRYTPIAEGSYLDSTLYTSESNVTANSCDAEIELYLKATAQVGEVSYKDTLDFGILYECATDSADAFIKNESSDIVKIDGASTIITGTDANYFDIAAKPNTISVGGQNNFLISYIPPTIPTTSGVKLATLEFELDPSNGKVETIIIKVEVDTFLVDYAPGKPFDMGQIPVGFNTAPQILTITNSGKLPRTVTGFAQPATSKIAITHQLGFPVTIPAGGSEDFDVDISLLAGDVGPYVELDTALFLMCDNRLPIEINAEGIEGKLEITTDLDLGVQPPCLDITELVNFRNAGQVDIELDSVIVEENGVEIYRMLNLPQTLTVANAANNFSDIIRIVNNNLTIGSTYNAILKAYVFENGATREYTKQITAQIKSGLIIDPNPVNFGNVFLNTLSNRPVNIRIDPLAPFANIQDMNITVDRVNLTPVYNEYQFVSPNQFTLNSITTSEIVDIDFVPTVTQNYNATLDLSVSVNGCDYNVPIELLAAGGAGDTLLVFVKDFLEVEPNQNDFRIPIYGKLMTSAATPQTVNVELSKLDINFNKTVYFPMTLSNSTFISRTTDPSLARISLKMDTPIELISGQEVVLTEMIGTTMLGNMKENLIQISSIELADETGISEKQFHGGLFNLTICEEGGQRLLEYTNGFNYTLFNTNDNIEIQANLVEPGNHKVKLINSTGQTQVIREIDRKKEDKNNYVINFDSSHLGSGVYYIVFETPARFKTQKLIIIR